MPVSTSSTAANSRCRAPASSSGPRRAPPSRRSSSPEPASARAAAGPTWRSTSVNGSNAASGSSEQRPSSTVASPASLGEPQREPRLADARLAGQQQQPPGAAVANEPPGLAQPRQLAGAADEQLLALEHGGRSDRRRRAIRAGRAQALFVLAPQLEHPLVVHPLQELAVAHGGGVVDAAGLEQGGGLAQVDPGAVERDGLARRDEARGLGPERPPQLAQRRPQAGARALVEHVGPEPRGELAARVRAGVRGQIGEQRAGAARRRQRDLAAVRLERQAPGEAHAEHRGNPIRGGAFDERQLRR